MSLLGYETGNVNSHVEQRKDLQEKESQWGTGGTISATYRSGLDKG